MVEIIDIGNCKINRNNIIAKIRIEDDEERECLEKCCKTLDIKHDKHISNNDFEQADLDKLKRQKESIVSILGENNNSNNNLKGKKMNKNNKITSIDYKKACDMKIAVNERICEFERDVVRPKGGLNNLNEDEKEEYQKLWKLLRQLNKLKTDLDPKKKKKIRV